jgi:hypothetical protein
MSLGEQGPQLCNSMSDRSLSLYKGYPTAGFTWSSIDFAQILLRYYIYQRK